MRNELNSKVRHKRHICGDPTGLALFLAKRANIFATFGSKVAQEMGLAYGCHRGLPPGGHQDPGP